MKKTWILLLSMYLVSVCYAVEITYNLSVPGLSFAAQHIEEAISARGESRPQMRIRLTVGDVEGVKPQGFSITRNQNVITVVGADAAGAMYGGLDLAETIRAEGFAAVHDKVRNPYMQVRGTKFNIPLDVRTPSYSCMSDAAQKNIPEMWNMDFWKEYIDTLAAARYNLISIWNLHPFPSMVKVPEYPDVAIDDVHRSVGDFNELYSLHGNYYDTPEIMNNVEIIKSMSIDDKIAFWREVMAYGKSRHIDFYIVTWNIFTYGTGGKYGITDAIDNETTRDYFRKSVKQLFVTYPDLAGIGLTTGENMYEASNKQKEEWVFATYGLGVLDAVKQQPERKIRFIHRTHETATNLILDQFKSLTDHPNIDFVFSFKYAQAHSMSATRQPFHENFVPLIEGRSKTLWTMRNDSNYHFRWAAPDFVREFIKNVPYDVSQGYYYGSDNYIWGREFLQKDPESPRQLEVVKQWLHWLLWGRMGYEPDWPTERIAAILSARWPEVDGSRLLDAWQKASMVYPRVTGFHWNPLDFQWYIEGCLSSRVPGQRTRVPGNFHSVDRFIETAPHRYSGYQSIPDFVRSGSANTVSPLDLANLLEQDAEAAIKTLESFGKVSSKELRQTFDDIRTMALMGKYYAEKIRGATQLARYRHTNDTAHQQAAIDALTRASTQWKQYVELATANYHNPLWTNRVGNVDWRKLTIDVLNDIEIARQANASN